MALESVDSDIREMLLPDEQIIFIASQSRVLPGGSLFSPNTIYITNIRVLYKDPRWYGLRAYVVDINYKDISTITLKHGIFSTELYFTPHFSNHKIKLPALDKKSAQRINQLIQRGIRGQLPSQDHTSAPEMQMVQMSATKSAATATTQQARHDEPAVAQVTKKVSCRYCNCSTITRDSNFCHECGKNLQVETNVFKACPGCNAVTPEDSIFCAFCHEKFPEKFLQ